jgi:AAA domain
MIKPIPIQGLRAASLPPVVQPAAVAVPTPPKLPPKLIQSSGEFIAGFVAPSYTWDGILQERFCYSLTAATGAGKTAIALRLAVHVALGRNLGDREVKRGRVLYFASENSVDVQARWIAMAEHCGFDVNAADVFFVSGATKLSEIADRITTEAKALGDLGLVVVDTSAATFEGADENGNVDSLQHAKRMRSLTELRGGPTVLVLCHPTKNATPDNLIPRGGGAFIAEIDGNLCARKSDSAVELHWAGKFRGIDFAPMQFRLDTVTAQRLKDNRGRNIPTVMATPMDEAGRDALAVAARTDENQVLRAIYGHSGASSNELAKLLKWQMRDGRPYGVRVRRAAEKLAGDGLILKHRGEWALSARGEKELNNLDRKAPGPNYPLTGHAAASGTGTDGQSGVVPDRPIFPPSVHP